MTFRYCFLARRLQCYRLLFRCVTSNSHSTHNSTSQESDEDPRWLARAAAPEAFQRTVEGFTEVRTEVGVDEGVESGVEVTYPEECSDDGVRAAAGRATHGDADVPHEEGQPTHHEGTHDKPQGPCCLVLSTTHCQGTGFGGGERRAV